MKLQLVDDDGVPMDLEIYLPDGFIVVKTEFLERMYNALPPEQRMPEHLYGRTLGDEYRALTGHKGY